LRPNCRSVRVFRTRCRQNGYDCGVFELAEIDASNWRVALAVEVRSDQVRFVADHQPVALVILSKCYVRPEGQTWTPYLALYDSEPVGVVAVVSEGDTVHLRHLAIDCRRQGEGLGRMLVDAVIAAIRRDQPMCRFVNVTAHPENEIALSLYLSAGFRRTGAMSGIEPVLALDLTEQRAPGA
jgi:ribosomal protein S18 acetylase RimI-like enzyme